MQWPAICEESVKELEEDEKRSKYQGLSTLLCRPSSVGYSRAGFGVLFPKTETPAPALWSQ